MTSLALAASFLLLSHFPIASTPLRGQLVRRLGEERYLASFSALTLVTFVWLVVAYLRAPALVLWATPRWVTGRAETTATVARQSRRMRRAEIASLALS
jgi:uncharacterized membrane protein